MRRLSGVTVTCVETGLSQVSTNADMVVLYAGFSTMTFTTVDTPCTDSLTSTPRWALASNSGPIPFGNQSLSLTSMAPNDFAGRLLWFYPSTGLWQDLAGTVPAILNNDPVLRWDDQSGNGNTLLDAGLATTALLVVPANNARNGISTDGVSAVLRTAVFSEPQPLHYFAVLKPTSAVGSARFISSRGNVNGVTILNQPGGNFGRAQSPAPTLDNNVLGATKPFSLVEVRADNAGASGYLRVNSAAAVTNAGLGATNPQGICLGGTSIGGNPAAGTFQEIVVYNNILTQPQADQVRAYFVGYYATP